MVFEFYQPFQNFILYKNSLCTKRSAKFEIFNHEVPFKDVAYPKIWNIPDE